MHRQEVKLGGKYVQVRRIGGGAFGEVFLGKAK